MIFSKKKSINFDEEIIVKHLMSLGNSPDLVREVCSEKLLHLDITLVDHYISRQIKLDKDEDQTYHSTRFSRSHYYVTSHAWMGGRSY